jgi:glucose/mannose transport system substrate-binding protein
MSGANDCMKKGLAILAKGNVVSSTDQLLSPDTSKQIEDLMVQFFKDPSITPEAAQKSFADIISKAD